MVETLLAQICRTLPFSKGFSHFECEFYVEGDVDCQPLWFQKTRVITLSSIVVSAVCSFILSQSTRVTDRQTDRQNYDSQDRTCIAASRSKMCKSYNESIFEPTYLYLTMHMSPIVWLLSAIEGKQESTDTWRSATKLQGWHGSVGVDVEQVVVAASAASNNLPARGWLSSVDTAVCRHYLAVGGLNSSIKTEICKSRFMRTFMRDAGNATRTVVAIGTLRRFRISNPHLQQTL